MPGKRFFEIPDNPQIVAALVAAIPSNWRWVEGTLNAPNSLLSSGEALADTNLWLSRFHTINSTIRGVRTENETKPPNLFGILLEHKLPGSVRFDEAGLDAHTPADITLSLAKKFAIAFIAKGYRGDLVFFSNAYRNYMYNNPERCSIDFFGEIGQVKIEWDENYGGNEKNIESFVATCKSLELRERQPV
jgi:hypothetical protein